MKKLWGFVNFVGLLIAAAGFITHSAVLIVLGIAVCLLGEWQKSRVSEAQRAQAQTGAIRPTLADVFDSADYQPDERLSGLDIDPMQLLLHQDYHYVDGCDKITATYHGVSVLLGNVRLMDTDVFRDEESGMERKTEKEVWQGLMLTCKVGHSFPIGFAIAPRGKIDGLLRYADVKTGNETFDKRFTVKTDNGDAALLTLTPRMQEKILAKRQPWAAVRHLLPGRQSFCRRAHHRKKLLRAGKGKRRGRPRASDGESSKDPCHRRRGEPRRRRARAGRRSVICRSGLPVCCWCWTSPRWSISAGICARRKRCA